MKKIILFTAIAMFAFTTTNAQGISFGAKAGLNLASVTGDGSDGVDGRTAFHVGAVVNIEFSELFALQPEVLYSAQGFSQNVDLGDLGMIESTLKLDYIIVPVLADITIIEGLSLQGGPQFGFNITSELEAGGETGDVDGVETVDIAAAIGAQFKLPLGLFFQARYVAGLTEIVDGGDFKNSNISVSVGWFFN
jgi:hypothetical protein